MAPTKKDMVYFEDSPDLCNPDTLSKYNFEGRFIIAIFKFLVFDPRYMHWAIHLAISVWLQNHPKKETQLFAWLYNH